MTEHTKPRDTAGGRSLHLHVRAFVLDMDDTVNRTSEAMDAGLHAAVATMWPELSPERLSEAVSGYIRDDAGWFERFSTGSIDFPTMRRGRLTELSRVLGGEVDELGFLRFERTYREVFEQSCRVHEDALRLIRRAATAGVPLGVLSNSAERMTRMKVRRLGLEGRFVAVLSCDQLAAGKPDPQAYLSACRSLGIGPADVGYVDDLRRDAEGGAQAGLQSVWLDRRGIGDDAADAGAGSPARVTSLDQIEVEPVPGR